jgi:FMN phosphatase YigB (HAD superfamily)
MGRLAVSCVALDFGGTVATPGASPRASDVVAVLETRFGLSVPVNLETALDDVRAEAKSAYRARGVQTSWETLLAVAARRADVRLPDLNAVVEALWDSVPDAAVDPLAAEAVRDLRRSGMAIVLACNTQRPIASRRQTLAAAGLDGCFAALVLSSQVGVGKPDPSFYRAVADEALAVNGSTPSSILFVGDTLDKDVTGPLAFGMQAVFVHVGTPPPSMPSDVPIIAHLADLPRLLDGWT